MKSLSMRGLAAGVLLLMMTATTALASPNAWAAEVCDVRDHGAGSGWLTDNTAAIQAAVDACHARGGGTVRLPPGRWLCGGIVLKDNIRLHVGQGAVLMGLPWPEAYPALPGPELSGVSASVADNTPRALVTALGATNIAVTGGGTIHGNGLLLGAWSDTVKPLGLRFESCVGVRVEGVTLKYAASWMQLYRDCRDVVVRDVTVYNHGNGQCDGLDLDGCRNVLVENVDIDAYDDALAIKASFPGAANRDITVRGCVLRSMKRAIKFGTESLGAFHNIRIADCRVERTRRSLANLLPQDARLGLFVAMVDGGTLRDVAITGLAMTGVKTPFYLVQDKRRADTPAGSVQGLRLAGLRATASTGHPSMVAAAPGLAMRDVVLEDIDIAITNADRTTVTITATSSVPELDGGKPKYRMLGDLPAAGIYARNVRGLTLRRFCLSSSISLNADSLAVLDTVEPATFALSMPGGAVCASSQPAP